MLILENLAFEISMSVRALYFSSGYAPKFQNFNKDLFYLAYEGMGTSTTGLIGRAAVLGRAALCLAGFPAIRGVIISKS